MCLLVGLAVVPTTGDEDEGVAAAPATAPRAETDDSGSGTPGGTAGAAVEPPPALPAPGGPGAPGAPAAPAGSPPAADTPGPPGTLPPPADAGPPADPGPAVPPRSGVYRYQVRGGGEEREATVTVEDRDADAGVTNQVVSQKGGGLDMTSDVSWRRDGVVVLRSVFTFGQNRGECDWEPDFLQLRLPLAKGVAWQSASSCAVTGIGPPLTVRRSVDARVVDLRRVRIAGRAVDVWAVESTDRFDIAGRVIEQRGTTLFSPRHGVVVAGSGTATVSGPDGSQSTDYSTELKNLDPA